MTYGQQWAIYDLMGTHASNGESDLMAQVITYKTNGIPGGNPTPTWSQALAQASRDMVDSTIQDSDIGTLPSLDVSDLITAIGLTGYDPSLGPCPKGGDRKAIAAALLAMTGPLP